MNEARKRKIFMAAKKKWGAKAQIVAAIEELNEAAAALARFLNEKGSEFSAQCELADAEIMLEQMRYYFDDDAIERLKDGALDKLASKLGVEA